MKSEPFARFHHDFKECIEPLALPWQVEHGPERKNHVPRPTGGAILHLPLSSNRSGRSAATAKRFGLLRLGLVGLGVGS